MKSIFLSIILVFCYSLSFSQINSNSFTAKTDYTSGTGTSNPSGIVATDLDNDNKRDIIVGNVGSSSISIFRNTTIGSSISLATKLDFASSNPVNFISTADLDGDGKTDVLASSNSGAAFSIFRNTTSTIGSITFGTRIDIVGVGGAYNFDIGDVDGDLKPDLVCINFNNSSISVFRNTSTVGSISFATRQDITSGSAPSSLTIYDVDGDGKNDIAVTLYYSAQVVIFRNTTTTVGSPTFLNTGSVTTGSYPHFIKSGDIDGDGKKDLVTGNFYGYNISVIKNNSTGINNFTFQSAQNFFSGSGLSYCQGITINDFDNDNKLDIGVCNYGNNNITVFKNTSVIGVINSSSLAAQVNFPANTNPTYLWAADLNGDLKSDIIVSNYASSNISIYRNQIIANEPTVAASNLNISTVSSSSVQLNFTKGNGVRRMVLARLGSAVNASPVDTYAYVANSIFGNGNQIGSGNFVVYSDTGNSATITGLTAGNTYHFSVIEFNGTTNYSNYLQTPKLDGSTFLGKVLFSKSSGNLNDLATWGPNLDGTGTAPTSFADSNTVYYVLNNATPAVGGNWIIGGNRSYVVFGDGSIVYNINIPSSNGIAIDSIVVKNNITLSIQGTLAVNKSFWENGSTALYYGSAAQTIVSGDYSNLQVVSAAKNMSGNVRVRNNLTMTASINTDTFTLTLGNSALNPGLLNRSAGTIIGKFRRWYAASTNSGSTGLFPIGSSTNYRPISIEYTSSPTTGGSYLAEFVPTNPGTAGLPLFDSPVLLTNAGVNGFWRLTNSGISGGTFTSTITATGFFSINDYTALKMICRTASSWAIPGVSGTNLGTNAAPVIIRTGLSTNSWEFGVGGDGFTNPLPVKFVQTKAAFSNKGVEVMWQTASEENNDYFIVEKLQNNNWEELGFIEGAGNSNKLNTYNFTDLTTLKELGDESNYYRIKQVDFDHKFSYSQVFSANESYTSGEIQIFPSPMTDKIKVSLGSEEMVSDVSIYNLSGQLVLNSKNAAEIDVNELSVGIYLIKVETNKNTYLRKISK